MNPVDSIADGTTDEFAHLGDVPAPWTLHGKGLIVIMRSKAETLRADLRIPSNIRDTLKTPLSVLMFVDYTHSNAGPYKELLYIPGTAQFKGQRRPTISNIVVSSASSVKNGRVNWGIPKNLCDFEVAQGPEGMQEISLHQNDLPQFELAYTAGGLQFPIHTSLVPAFMKTLGQHWQGKEFVYSPSAKGKARFAKIHTLKNLGDAFPDLDIADVVTALEITRFEMTFPVAQVSPT